MKINEKHNILTVLFCLIIIYAYYLFFDFFSVLGISYHNGYLEIYSIILLCVAIILYILQIINNKKILYSDLLICLSLVLIILDYVIVDIVYGYSDTAWDTMLDFFARSVPAILLGIIVAKKRCISLFQKCIWIIVGIFAICDTKILLSSFLYGYSAKDWNSIFLMDYQNASYTAAFAVGLSLSMLIVISEKKHQIFETVYYIYSIIVCSLTALYSGGRGGVVLILWYIAILWYLNLKNNHKISKKIMILVVGIFTLFLLYFVVASNELLSLGFSRAFEFIGDSGKINWEGTSGRLEIYQGCLEKICKKPLFGYGITGAPHIGIERAHNIFLDILIDGGVTYFILWIFLIILSLKHLYKEFLNNSSYIFIIVFFLGDFILLMFSSVYMRTSAIWFVISFSITDIVLKRGKN